MLIPKARGVKRGLMVVALVLCAAVVSVASSALSPASNAGAAAKGAASNGPVGAPSSELVPNLTFFRRARSSSDELPAQLDRDLPNIFPPTMAAGVNPALSRRVQFTEGDAVYVLPTNEGVCVVNSGRSQHFCAATPEILAGAALASTECSPLLPNNVIEIAGILPGVTAATVTLSNGTSVALPVSENTYEARFVRSGPLPVSISWGSPRHTVSAGVPSDAVTEDCVTPPKIAEQVARGELPAPVGSLTPASGKIEYTK